ncbi:TPA: hypothetical protein N0F65_008770 [Lagenidium giganteum]|uniref:Menorin-like domain-containing protein n=1 Tax=Lagenidium giganteum TaxID=4803 RepID=A0AAV2Z1P9_9STRA|nr:TPA: hypothetical protein N0F65_008770 [Lagenidium giganteum]
MRPLEFRWAHAVNSQALLREVTEDVTRAHAQAFRVPNYVNAIEADIIWSERQQQPVMGHPPQTDGDLPLHSFLDEMLVLARKFEAQGYTPSEAQPSGFATPWIVKLDFKSMHAFQVAYPLLGEFVTAFPYKHGVFINADILPGPANTPDVHFEAHEFLEMATALGAKDVEKTSKLVLSVGWTTANATDEEIHRCYTKEMVDSMFTALQPFRATGMRVTFPLRATCFRQSWSVLRPLVDGIEHHGITLWWTKFELPTTDLEWIYKTLENDESLAGRTFYDILGFDKFMATRRLST